MRSFVLFGNHDRARGRIPAQRRTGRASAERGGAHFTFTANETDLHTLQGFVKLMLSIAFSIFRSSGSTFFSFQNIWMGYMALHAQLRNLNL